jgi:hypothetical protein
LVASSGHAKAEEKRQRALGLTDRIVVLPVGDRGDRHGEGEDRGVGLDGFGCQEAAVGLRWRQAEKREDRTEGRDAMERGSGLKSA